ncbi:hypothetical protein NF556_15510 [Ornithinimicrobium faecis]|uniref:Uncharacterized protein n=1 Tax=Ornithinimicrobium faecis TaxID=2934158 RepID=A0ABY4YQP4_9MICO|nr:hypothetical protein [Ornithinimicrobium sp. HY1793]USQ79019.1 hypothetical protein NF556_15510 [Ornithinimicrobium sp. HY1793]
MTVQSAREHGRGREWPPPMWRRPSVWVCAVLALTLVAIAGTWWWQREKPRRVAEDFLQAQADGDLERAADLGPQPLWKPEDDTIRTVTIPGSAGPAITDWTIDEIERLEGWTRVEATIVSASGEHPVELTVNDGHLDPVDYPSVKFHVPTASGAITVNDERVGLSNLYGMTLGGLGIGTIYLSPGTHTLALPDLSSFVTSQPQTVTLPPDFSSMSSAEDVDLTYELTGEGEAEIERLFRELVEECTTGDQPAEADCPISTDDIFLGGGEPPDGTWEIASWPDLQMEPVDHNDGWWVETARAGEAVFTVAEGPSAEQTERVVRLSFTSRVELQADGSLAFA